MKFKDVPESAGGFTKRGGFGSVSVVEDVNGNRFAKKTLNPDQALIENVGQEHLERRFKREVKYQSAVQHKNVVPIIESFLDQDPPFFIMPLAEGTLQDELKLDSSLSGNYKEVLYDVLAGIERLHELGYVHRDLKPANILKISEGEQHYYAVSDFGLMSVDESDSSTLTGSNAQGGTQNYAAPELMRNFKAATPVADIYSFGAILHDIFGSGARRIPFTELTVPGPLGDVVQKCTKTNPIRRYSSISKLREDLYNVLSTGDVEFSSNNEEKLAEILKKSDQLTDDEWDEIFLLFEEDEERVSHCRNIFANLTFDHLNNLKNSSPELFIALGHYFSNFITHNGFDFDYCDVLANKAEFFYEYGDVSLKAKIMLGLLELGTSHNRWYVERKYYRLTTESDSNVISRMLIEADVNGINLGPMIKHLERSIGVSRLGLNPLIVEYLDEKK
ncbi:hypothetical protein JCM30760_12100 [Thiomicrorhabdus hydrogeniphila]